MNSGKEYPLSNIYNMIMRPVLFNDIRFTVVDGMIMSKKNDLFFGAHIHPCYECVYVCKGMFFTYSANRHMITTEGHCVVVPPGVSHSHYLDDTECEIYSIRFLLEKVNLEASASGENTLCYDTISEYLSDFLYDYPNKTYKMLEDLKGKPSYSQQAILIHWLLGFTREHQEENGEITQEKKKENLADQVELYLNEFYKKNITVMDIATSLNVSYRHLARIYKAERGMTFIEKLTSIRIDHAKRELIETQKPIKQIALEFSFSSEYYFATLFKKTTGFTPTAYRKQYGVNQ
jgi:AraC-like DNA-binding protein